MKFKALKNKSASDLQKLLNDNRASLQELRFKVAADQLKNLRQVRETKKTIARLLMLLKRKHIESKVSSNNPASAQVSGDKPAVQPAVSIKD